MFSWGSAPRTLIWTENEREKPLVETLGQFVEVMIIWLKILFKKIVIHVINYYICNQLYISYR